MAQAPPRKARGPLHRRGGLKVGLAGFDLADPTDRAVAENLSAALGRKGVGTAVFGPGIPGPGAREVDLWNLHLFGRDVRPFVAAAERGRRPVATTLHLVLSDYLPFAGGRRTLTRLSRLGPLAAVSEAQRREAVELVPALRGRLRLVRPGPSLPALPRRPPGPVPTLLCAARLAPYKGIDVLLMAFARLLDRGVRARLVLAGRDKTRDGLAAFSRRLGLAHRVRFLGELSPRALASQLARADIFVLPSRRENFPLALLEAMAAGLPAVATRTGGVPELAGRAALLVPPGDPGALSAALKRLLTDPGLRRRLARAARRRAALFTWDKSASAHLALYREAL
ncbi:glycosyltransferase family 1 protein [bacterium]|nr:MAG: glycosyltransferase family 1 protein [bacterium]